jgi:LDH2 family malate/lactate/ureidoglycolate dehydrogenase
MMAPTQSVDNTVLLPAEVLSEVVERTLHAAGADPDAAAIVAESLVASDLCGVSSHGVVRVPDYLRAIRLGRIDPTARPTVEFDGGAVVRLAGNNSFGQIAAREMAAVAADRAEQHGVGLVMLAGVEHVGRLGEWVERAAAAGCVALAWCNCGDSYGNVVPYGGEQTRLGTNPMAYAVPLAGGEPLVADFSTSVVSEGKVRVLRQLGLTVPDGWLLDAAGRPTNDPGALYNGGALLPAGGHKGFALGLLVEILGGVMAGAGCVSLGEAPGNGLVFLAIDTTSAPTAFGERVAEVVSSIRSSGSGVQLPGDPEQLARAQGRLNGVTIARKAWTELLEAAAELGLQVPPTQTNQGDTYVV